MSVKELSDVLRHAEILLRSGLRVRPEDQTDSEVWTGIGESPDSRIRPDPGWHAGFSADREVRASRRFGPVSAIAAGMRLTSLFAPCVFLVLGTWLLTGCSGAVAGTGSGGGTGPNVEEGSSTSSISDGHSGGGSSSSEGTSTIVVPPPGPPPGPCAPGAACEQGTGCATASAGGVTSCSYSCTCGPSGVFDCEELNCVDASPPPTGCTQGAVCSLNAGCGMGSPGGCSTICNCDATGHLQCSTSCPTVDAGCVQNVLCVAGDHFDPTQCRCVPDTLGCCRAGWDLYGCTDVDGGAGFNCRNPALGCASSLTCGGGCDSQVTGFCSPVCDPIPCRSGEMFDSTKCACVIPGCNTAADCTGGLPALCEICGDGGVGCAHWSCVAGQCVDSFCD